MGRGISISSVKFASPPARRETEIGKLGEGGGGGSEREREGGKEREEGRDRWSMK